MIEIINKFGEANLSSFYLINYLPVIIVFLAINLS